MCSVPLLSYCLKVCFEPVKTIKPITLSWLPCSWSLEKLIKELTMDQITESDLDQYERKSLCVSNGVPVSFISTDSWIPPLPPLPLFHSAQYFTWKLEKYPNMFFILVPFHCRLFFTYDVVLGGLLLCFPESPPLKSNSVPDRLKALHFCIIFLRSLISWMEPY